MLNKTQQRGEPSGHAGDGGQLSFVEFPILGGHTDEGAAEHFLQHRAGHAKHTDAGGDVHAQHHPHQPKLGDAPHLAGMDVPARDHGRCRSAGRGRWGDAVGCPTRWWDAVGQGPAHHENEVQRGHDHERRGHTDIGWGGEVLHQLGGQR
jgi:hypothetical protein